MKITHVAAVALLLAGTSYAQQPQQEAPPRVPPGARHVPDHIVPVPDTVSPQMQAIIAQPYNPSWNVVPKSARGMEGDRRQGGRRGGRGAARDPPGARCHGAADHDRGREGVHRHAKGDPAAQSRPRSGARAWRRLRAQPRRGGDKEAIELAGFGGFKVISVDYRMPPDFPYPAAMDDAMAVYRAVLKTTKAKNIGIFGTSTGGGMTLAMVLRAKMEHLPLPGAIAPGTPWSDMTKTGDSFYANEMLDNVLVSDDGFLHAAALLYANGHDLKDPLLSPVYGDMHGFPPTILTSGTRDLFLSNTVRVHRKLREAGVEAVLQVFEGESHAQY